MARRELYYLAAPLDHDLHARWDQMSYAESRREVGSMVEQTMLTGLYRALLKTIELSKELSRLEVICSAIHSNLASQAIDAESENFSETLYLVCGQYGSELLETNTDPAKSVETISTHLEKNLLTPLCSRQHRFLVQLSTIKF